MARRDDRQTDREGRQIPTGSDGDTNEMKGLGVVGEGEWGEWGFGGLPGLSKQAEGGIAYIGRTLGKDRGKDTQEYS